jgi:5'-3' exonuclease
MGIKYFFKWFKQSFSENIKIIKTTENFDIDIDNFLIDMNGIFHFCAQNLFFKHAILIFRYESKVIMH